MPSVILSWHRVLASVRAYPPPAIRQGIRDVLRAEPGLQPIIGAAGGEARMVETIYGLLRESISEHNEDEKYYLRKLAEHNKEAEAFAEYLEALVGISQDLATREKDKKTPYACTTKAQPRSWMQGLPLRPIPIPRPPST